MIENKNDHIQKYLDYYTSLNIAPGFAILLRGEWGCGKSWFMKKYIADDERYIYVSLNGISTIQEINEDIFRQLHPVLGSKGMKIAGKILKGLIKTTIKVDFGHEQATINPTIPDLDLLEQFKKIENKILIFDDLERCSIPIHNTLGYINQFVESNELKVILIANETEIIKLELIQENTLNKYTHIKEKLIGKSFNIASDFTNAIQSFLQDIQTDDVRKILNDRVNIIHGIFESAKYNNLRHLRLAILDFERFSIYLPDDCYSKTEFIDHTIKLFFILSFEFTTVR